jgi:hypothetical protein
MPGGFPIGGRPDFLGRRIDFTQRRQDAKGLLVPVMLAQGRFG